VRQVYEAIKGVKAPPPVIGPSSRRPLNPEAVAALQYRLRISPLEGTGEVLSVAFSLDGRQVLTGSADNTARLWDLQTGQEIRRSEGHTDWVSSVAFSPDGRQVLTGSGDKTARLWDAKSGRQIYIFYVLRSGGWIPLTDRAFLYDGSKTTPRLLLNHLTVADSQGKQRQLTEEDFARFHRPDLVEAALRR
jgi:WD40 repeat protein